MSNEFWGDSVALALKAALSVRTRRRVTIIDSPYYWGAFQLLEAAEQTGFSITNRYEFCPLDFPGYIHTMTHQDESALGENDEFSTWRFQHISVRNSAND